jgi:hypothetical protein
MAGRRARLVGLGVTSQRTEMGHPGIGMHRLVAFEGLNGSADGDCAAG